MRRSLAAALLAASLAAPAFAEPRTIVDGAGRTVTVADTSKVLALGGSVTETLYALGLADRIAAVDTTSLYPPQALAEKPNVGYLRALSAEGVLSVGPSAIIAEHDAGPPDAVALLEAASVPFLQVPDERSAAGVAAKIRFIGDVMGASDRSEEIASALEADFATLEEEREAITKPSRAIFILSIADGRIMAAGTGTAADAMLRLAGAGNALTATAGYRPVNAEALLAAAPDAIVVMERHGNAPGPGIATQEVLDHPVLGQTPAARSGRIIAMDGLYLLGFGPRTAHAAHDLAQALYPDLSFPALAARPWVSAQQGQ